MNATAEQIELTVLMPCLNEARTIHRCIAKALAFFDRAGISGEVLVADNGSSDGSIEIARAIGARVIRVEARGYGNALRTGIAHARGRFVIMGDADDSYDFSKLDMFVERLRSGDQLVMGNRFSGSIEPGAMPWHHRYVGNPVLSFVGRLLYASEVGDFHCGLRGFCRDAIVRLNLASEGMEFASEMVVKASLHSLRISEVPTTLAKDGRDRPPHLRSFRDGWRHLRFLFLHCPRWLFLYPGIALFLAGVVFQAVLYFGPVQFAQVGLDVHSMLFAAAALIVGLQIIVYWVVSQYIAWLHQIFPSIPRLVRQLTEISLERGLLFGGGVFLIGLTLALWETYAWVLSGFAAREPTQLMREVIPSISMMVTGAELTLASLFVSIARLGTPARAAATEPAASTTLASAKA